MQSEYLIFNIFIIFGPFFGFFVYPKSVFPNLKRATTSILLVASLFIIWDILVTDYFWSFNDKYVLGYKFIKTPFEEALFFFTVPYACLFLYLNFKVFLKSSSKVSVKTFYVVSFSLFYLLLSFLFLFMGKYYTFSVFFIWPLVLLVDVFVMKTRVSLGYFYWFFMIAVFFLTLIFNYYLTSRPVVLYNDNLNLGFRILTIPIEDFFYSSSLISLVIIIYEFLQEKLR